MSTLVNELRNTHPRNSGYAETANMAADQIDALVKALEELQAAEIGYRMCHDLDGDGHINTGRAWDKLRQAGQRARAVLGVVGGSVDPS